METKKEIKIRPIKDGTAIDHLPVGTALKVVEILKIPKEATTVAMNVPSKKHGKKDIVFIENRKLKEEEIDKIALIARNATINLIHGSGIAKKERATIPEEVTDIIKCINPNCITNREAVQSKFIIKERPLSAKCFYCETIMDEKEIANGIK
ncbi:MAG: aspartate carbamoyltransferase regulatory subunit [Candidatus Diapherotrites archaeon]